MLDTMFVLLWFYFMSPEWATTKIRICVFGASNGLSLSTACNGHQRIWHAILIANDIVPIGLCNENCHEHVFIYILGN